MNRSPISSTSEKETLSLLWGCELNQERPAWTFKPQKVGRQDCVLLLSTISLGEKAKEEVNVVEILPSASQDDKKRKPLTLASLRASVLPMVVLGLEFSPPVTFQLRAGSGPVFLCGQEHYNRSWEEVEEEEEDLEEEEDDDDDDKDVDMFLEETPIKQVKRLVPQKQTGAAKEKKMEKKEEAVRHHRKGSPAGKPKKARTLKEMRSQERLAAVTEGEPVRPPC